VSQFSEEVTVTSDPERVFALYENVANWKQWDPDVASSSISGPFAAGTTGKLKPTNGPEAKIKIVSVEKNKSFTVQSRLPLCTMTFEHELFPVKGATRVVHRVSFNGPLSFFFGRVVGNQIRKGLPGTLLGLKQAVEHTMPYNTSFVRTGYAGRTTQR
jgi:hypothetical protein